MERNPSGSVPTNMQQQPSLQLSSLQPKARAFQHCAQASTQLRRSADVWPFTKLEKRNLYNRMQHCHSPAVAQRRCSLFSLPTASAGAAVAQALHALLLPNLPSIGRSTLAPQGAGAGCSGLPAGSPLGAGLLVLFRLLGGHLLLHLLHHLGLGLHGRVVGAGDVRLLGLGQRRHLLLLHTDQNRDSAQLTHVHMPHACLMQHSDQKGMS